ncbi:MAG: hypothetical protein OXH92_20030 [Bryobacterales bacterium]|nr:hypothetical protein [Bryobacterales bacterium]MDE0296507.1 hypothetical protein [Bryobacterales bacterium]MDE0436295.1 hypothetical protein [Bryobacterales bacterium]
MKMLADLRYEMIDLIESSYGSAVAAVVFFASWGALTMWFLLWGFFLGWIPAAVMAAYIGYRCR